MNYWKELVILKITAINSANNDIVASFSESTVTINELRNINEQFSLSLPLWNIRHFRYFLAQEFASRVESAFNISKFVNEYDKNRIFLEQLINTRRMIVSEKESNTIGIFATVLSILQVVPLLYSIILHILEGKEIGIFRILAFAASSVITVIIVLLLFRKKKEK